MKVYMIYLIKPDNLSDVYSEEIITDYKEMTYGFRNMHSCEYNNKTCYLYGFTNKKEYYKIFRKTHDENLFIYIKKDIKKDDYYELREYGYAELIEYECKEHRLRLIVTQREADELDDIGGIEEYVTDLENYVSMPYEWYKEEYVQALDKLLYCNYYCIYDDERSDEILYNLSYGVSAEGYASGINAIYMTIPVYIKMYKLLLRK